MSKAPKHHFVPWSFLRYFAIDPEASRKTSTIHMWDKKASVECIQKTDSVQCYVRGLKLDIRLITPEKTKMLMKMKIKQVHFAWDNYADKDIIIPKFREFKKLLVGTSGRWRYTSLKND